MYCVIKCIFKLSNFNSKIIWTIISTYYYQWAESWLNHNLSDSPNIGNSLDSQKTLNEKIKDPPHMQWDLW